MMKPVIIGMNNPISVRPEFALYPAPEGCAGHRLWRMLNEACGASRRQYVDGFERLNVLVGVWDYGRAVAAANALRPRVAGRDVVLLGEDVWRAMCGQADVGKCGSTHVYWGAAGRTVIWRVPHPSGRNPWYNEPAHRQAVGALLARLMREGSQ